MRNLEITTSSFCDLPIGLLVSGNKDATETGDEVKIDATLKAGTGTDSETLAKEGEAINADGLNAKEVNELRKNVSCDLSPLFHSEIPRKTGFSRSGHVSASRK